VVGPYRAADSKGAAKEWQKEYFKLKKIDFLSSTDFK
jgi:hypothetical protein